MTTDMRVRWAADAVLDNEVFRLDREGEAEARVAAVTWTLEGEPVHSAHRLAAEHAMRVIRTQFFEWSAYLLAAHTAPQPDTAAVRHRKLWGSLSMRDLKAQGDDLGEFVLSHDRGLRWFGLRRLASDDVASSIMILEQEAASLLVTIPREREDVLKQLVAHGWPAPGRHPSYQLVVAVVQAGGIVLWPLGSFDDREPGVVAFADPGAARVLAQPEGTSD